jgi:preprotein translocase subunit SecG
VITVLVVLLHILVALTLILVVLLQVGKGGSIGAAFGGGGSSQTLFGSRGPATFLSRLTTAAAAIFMITSLSLAYLSSHTRQRSSITDEIPAPESAPPAQQTPAPESPPSSETPSSEKPPASEAPASEGTPTPTPPAQEPQRGQQ